MAFGSGGRLGGREGGRPCARCQPEPTGFGPRRRQVPADRRMITARRAPRPPPHLMPGAARTPGGRHRHPKTAAAAAAGQLSFRLRVCSGRRAPLSADTEPVRPRCAAPCEQRRADPCPRSVRATCAGSPAPIDTATDTAGRTEPSASRPDRRTQCRHKYGSAAAAVPSTTRLQWRRRIRAHTTFVIAR